MFEFTKLIYLWRCVFIHFYFFTMFFFFFFFWLPFFVAFLVCNIHMVALLLLLLQLEKMLRFLVFGDFLCFLFFSSKWLSAGLTQHMWTCAPLHLDQLISALTVHVNNQDSIFKKAWVNIIYDTITLISFWLRDSRKNIPGICWY